MHRDSSLETNSKKAEKQYLLLLTGLLVIGELIFRFIAESEIEETMVKVALIALPLVFVLLQKQWAKWVASLILILNGILFFAGMLTLKSAILGLVGAFNIFFALSLHFSRKLKSWFSKEDTPQLNDNVNNEDVVEPAFDYPYLLTRFKATMIDGGLLAVFLIVLLLVTSEVENRPLIAIVFCLVALLYEPLMLWFNSATIGHVMVGIRVLNVKQTGKKLNLFHGLIRVISKYVLGWLSFVTINFNPGHRAIHDFLSSSIVVKDSPEH